MYILHTKYIHEEGKEESKIFREARTPPNSDLTTFFRSLMRMLPSKEVIVHSTLHSPIRDRSSSEAPLSTLYLISYIHMYI